MTKWVLAPFFPFILLFVKIGSLFNNGEEWQKLDQALTMIGNDIVRFCQLVLQLYVIFTKVVTLIELQYEKQKEEDYPQCGPLIYFFLLKKGTRNSVCQQKLFLWLAMTAYAGSFKLVIDYMYFHTKVCRKTSAMEIAIFY